MKWEQAREVLVELLRDFQFAEEADRARAVAALMTPALEVGQLIGPSGRMPLTLLEADDA